MVGLPQLFGFEPEQISKAVDALKKFDKKRQQAQKTELFSDDRQYIYIQVQFNRCAEQKGLTPTPQVLQIPNPIYDLKELDICLFVGNQGNRNDALVKEFEGKFSIDKVISARQLKREYDEKDAQVKLLRSYDLFLLDDRADVWVPRFLGKSFSGKNVYAPRVNLGINQELSTSLEQQIINICNNTWMTLTGTDKTSIRIGHMNMPTEQIYQNTIKVLEQFNDPNILSFQFDGITSLFLIARTYPALPIWFNVLSDLDSDVVPEEEQNKKQKGKKKGGKKKKKKDDKLYYISDEDGAKSGYKHESIGEEVDIEGDDEMDECQVDDSEEGSQENNIDIVQEENIIDNVQVKNTTRKKKQQKETEQEEVVQLLSSVAGKRKRSKKQQMEEFQDTEEQLSIKVQKRKKGKSKETKNFLVV